MGLRGSASERVYVQERRRPVPTLNKQVDTDTSDPDRSLVFINTQAAYEDLNSRKGLLEECQDGATLFTGISYKSEFSRPRRPNTARSADTKPGASVRIEFGMKAFTAQLLETLHLPLPDPRN